MINQQVKTYPTNHHQNTHTKLREHNELTIDNGVDAEATNQAWPMRPLGFPPWQVDMGDTIQVPAKETICGGTSMFNGEQVLCPNISIYLFTGTNLRCYVNNKYDSVVPVGKKGQGDNDKVKRERVRLLTIVTEVVKYAKLNPTRGDQQSFVFPGYPAHFQPVRGKLAPPRTLPERPVPLMLPAASQASSFALRRPHFIHLQAVFLRVRWYSFPYPNCASHSLSASR